MTGKEFSGPVEVAPQVVPHTSLDTQHRKYVTADGIPTDIHPATFKLTEESVERIQNYARYNFPLRDYTESYEDLAQATLQAFMERYQNEAPPVEDARIAYAILKNKISHSWYDSARRQKYERLTDTIVDKADATSCEPPVPLDPLLYKKIRGLLTKSQAKLLDLVLENPDEKGIERAARLGIKPPAERIQRLRIRENFLRQEGVLTQYLEDAGIGVSNNLREGLKGREAARKPESPPTTISLRYGTIKEINKHVGAGNEAAVYIPDFLGQWEFATKSILTFLRGAEGSGYVPRVGVVYPHTHLARQLEDYVRSGSTVNEERLTLYVGTTEEITELQNNQHLDYLVLSGESSPTQKRFRGTAGAILRLLSDRNAETWEAEGRIHKLPSYADAGGRKINWTPEDTSRYLRQWFLTTGEELTAKQITAIAERGEGPPLKRVCRGIGSFMSVQSYVGYTLTDLPPRSKRTTSRTQVP